MNLYDYLPSDQYGNEEHVTDYMQALSFVMGKLRQDYDDFMLQIIPETSSWALHLFEKEYALAADEKKPLAQRKSHLYAKMRGRGTTTLEVLRSIASEFYSGDIEVFEHSAEYRLEMRFIGDITVPPGINDLYSVIEEIKPAHLAFQFSIEHVYNTEFCTGTAHSELSQETVTLIGTVGDLNPPEIEEYIKGAYAELTYEKVNLER